MRELRLTPEESEMLIREARRVKRQEVLTEVAAKRDTLMAEVERLRYILARAVQSEDNRYRGPGSREKRPAWLEDARYELGNARAALEGERE